MLPPARRDLRRALSKRCRTPFALPWQVLFVRTLLESQWLRKPSLPLVPGLCPLSWWVSPPRRRPSFRTRLLSASKQSAPTPSLSSARGSGACRSMSSVRGSPVTLKPSSPRTFRASCDSPCLISTPMPFTHFHNDFESKRFVPTSATFFKPSTFINSMRRSWMCFCSHKHGVCKCRTLPTPRLDAMPAPAVAS